VQALRPEVPRDLAELLERVLLDVPAGGGPGAAEVATALKPFAAGSDLLALLGSPGRPGVDPVPGTGEESGPEIVPAETLQAALEVFLCDEQQRRRASLTEPGALPVRTGTRLQIAARLNRPAYLYLVWITSEGAAQPLYPWRPGRWEPCPAADTVASLVLPPPAPGRPRTWSIDTPGGVETLVLMARVTPLPEAVRARLPELFSGFPRRAAVGEPGRGFWFECRDPGRSPAGWDGPEAGPVPAPIAHIRSLLHDRLGADFSLVRAVSFANVGGNPDP
jgi:hypothetical protein